MDRRPRSLVALVGLVVVVGGVALEGCGASPGGATASPGPSLVAVDGTPEPALSGATVAPAMPSPSADDAPSAPPAPSPLVSPAASAPAVAPGSSPTPKLNPPPTAGPFEMDLYRTGDFVTEKMPIWCAPAAMQTMINIMSPGADTTRKTQKLLHTIARRLGPAPDKGSEPEGEARTLTSLGYGAYRVIAVPTRAAAFKAAATAIRLTGRPVALLVWRGAHNWVVSGFRSTADPALTDRFKVTHLRIEDVWYPRISSIWGASRPPDTLVPVRLMPEDYLPWRRPTGRYPGKDGKFVLIIPEAG